MFVVDRASTQGWSAEVSLVDARFLAPRRRREEGHAFLLPRVWPSEGLGLADRDLTCVLATLAQVMKTVAYWMGRSRQLEYRDPIPWSLPCHDAEEEFTYFPGPCELHEHGVGYQPRPSFGVEHADLRQLRIRLAGHLAGHAAHVSAISLQRDHSLEASRGSAETTENRRWSTTSSPEAPTG
jgi:hypothetical protein